MKNLIAIFLFIFLFLTTTKVSSQSVGKGYNKEYSFLHSGNLIVDKNFYLITVIEKTPALRKLVLENKSLHQLLINKKTILEEHANDTCSWPESLLIDFLINRNDSLFLLQEMNVLYEANTFLFDKAIDLHLRQSGYYQRFIGYDNKMLLSKAISQYIVGINYIIQQFGLGKKLRYPRIDSASYVVTSRYYRMALKEMFGYLSEKSSSMDLIFHPSLLIALQLMDMNDRDEPARFEPMEQTVNKAAIKRLQTIPFSKYRFASIVIPGNGPELFTTPISPINKMHCDIAADRFLKGWAPVIIVSGGYCYPFQGPYCEAVEMKKYLVSKYHIQESAILIDPHARHTTTNFRNANRLMIRYGIPISQLSVFITTQGQSKMVTSTSGRSFDNRNLEELGYLPYQNLTRIDRHCVSYYPVMESLHMDPFDPLDP